MKVWEICEVVLLGYLKKVLVHELLQNFHFNRDKLVFGVKATHFDFKMNRKILLVSKLWLRIKKRTKYFGSKSFRNNALLISYVIEDI